MTAEVFYILLMTAIVLLFVLVFMASFWRRHMITRWRNRRAYNLRRIQQYNGIGSTLLIEEARRDARWAKIVLFLLLDW